MTTLFRLPDGRILPEHPTFERWHAGTCTLVYVSLVVGENKSQRFILSDLKPAFDSGMDYEFPQPDPAQQAAAQLDHDIADALALWRKIRVVPGAPILVLEPDALLNDVNDSRNVTVIPARAA